MKVDLSVDVMTKAFNAHWGRRRRILRHIIFILSVIVIVLGILLIIVDKNRALGIFSVLLGGFALVAVSYTSYIIKWRLGRQYKQMGEDVANVDMNYDEDHLYIKTPQSESKIKWDTFIKWKEHDGLILAYRNDLFFQVIPIGQFQQIDQDNIRNYLSNNSKQV